MATLPSRKTVLCRLWQHTACHHKLPLCHMCKCCAQEDQYNNSKCIASAFQELHFRTKRDVVVFCTLMQAGEQGDLVEDVSVDLNSLFEGLRFSSILETTLSASRALQEVRTISPWLCLHRVNPVARQGMVMPTHAALPMTACGDQPRVGRGCFCSARPLLIGTERDNAGSSPVVAGWRVPLHQQIRAAKERREI